MKLWFYIKSILALPPFWLSDFFSLVLTRYIASHSDWITCNVMTVTVNSLNRLRCILRDWKVLCEPVNPNSVILNIVIFSSVASLCQIQKKPLETGGALLQIKGFPDEHKARPERRFYVRQGSPLSSTKRPLFPMVSFEFGKGWLRYW